MEAPAQQEGATTTLDESNNSQTVQKTVVQTSPDKSPLEDMVRILQPQRLERALSEVRDWLAGKDRALTSDFVRFKVLGTPSHCTKLLPQTGRLFSCSVCNDSAYKAYSKTVDCFLIRCGRIQFHNFPVIGLIDSRARFR